MGSHTTALKILSFVTKCLATAIGIFCLFWGYMGGIVGMSPGGALSGLERLSGLFILLFGVLAIIPRNYITRRRFFTISYISVTTIPGLVFLVALAIEPLPSDLSGYDRLAAPAIIIIYAILLLLAPLSVLLYIKTPHKHVESTCLQYGRRGKILDL